MNRIVGFTTIFAIFWFIIDSIVNYQEQFIYVKVIIESLIIAIFSVDYAYRFIKSPDKKAFFRNIYSMIELMSFLPFLIGAISLFFVNMHFVWGLRVWKFFSFLRVERYLPLINYAKQSFKNHLHKFEIALLFFGMLWIISGIIMYYVE
jgi:voltage-gated potassium channel